jgi:hypothetical protein
MCFLVDDADHSSRFVALLQQGRVQVCDDVLNRIAKSMPLSVRQAACATVEAACELYEVAKTTACTFTKQQLMENTLVTESERIAVNGDFYVAIVGSLQ